ncbi:MAG: MBL fold metallo-hydrolase [Lentisphaerae bacterium]|nr:MBL fold metallo-hydrolase [Lentisphaerota bacterium]MCP4099847.1 MBL fold metallo-hydrolase [Lentisphaerota bacterium]
MRLFTTLIAIFLSIAGFAAQPIIYVNTSASGSGTGTDWTNACNDLQTALKNATQGQQIWVAKGKYYPTNTTDRNISFKLKSGVSIYGGFAGGEKKLSDRNWKTNQTILSGNIGDKSRRDDNSKHVVITADNSVLDGFIVQCGYAMMEKRPQQKVRRRLSGGKPQNHTSPLNIMANNDACGAGILNYKAAGIIRNTIVRNCYAMKGGGVYNMTCRNIRDIDNNPSPVFINVTLKNNFAMGRGGGMANDLQTNPVLINCTFKNNYCAAKGGALYNDFSCSPIMLNCLFSKNKAYDAGAIGSDGGSCPILVRTEIKYNIATNQGAGLYQGSYNASRPEARNAPVLIYCTVKNNHSETVGPVITTWGQDWIYAWHSDVEDWKFGVSAVPPQYAKLLEISEKIKNMDATEIQNKYLKSIKLFLPTKQARDLGAAKADFRSDYPLHKTASIPDRIFYVSKNKAIKQHDGKSWGTAFEFVREALVAAKKAGGGEIWVATGVYVPTFDKNRSLSFKLGSGIALYGGFKGDETKLEMRNFNKYRSILSGNIGDPKKSTDNSYHVVFGASNSILDGFTITGGYADGSVKNCYGGGLFCWGNNSSPIVRNCVFTGNYAYDGGAVFAFENVRAYFKNITVVSNEAELGGGMSFRFGSSSLIEDSNISNNIAVSRGGGAVINYGSNVEFKNTVFNKNSTKGNGGAVWVDDQASQYGGTSPVFDNCTFENNRAGYYGGAIHSYNISTSKISNCIFKGNKAKYGNDVANTLRSRVTMQDNKIDAGNIYTDSTSRVYHKTKLSKDSGTFSTTIIGSGSPHYDPNRSGPSVLIRCGTKKFLVDMGNGTQARLAQAGITRLKLDLLMFTHHHLDHNEEFIPIFISVLLTGNPFKVVGPPPTEDMTKSIMRYYRQDIKYRLSRQNRDINDIDYSVLELQGGESFNYGGVEISTTKVNHTIHTIAYRFDYKKKSIVISGDLSYSPSLPKLAKNTDLLVIDSGGVIKENQKRRLKTPAIAHKNRAHSTLDELGKMLKAANAKLVILTHITPGKIDKPATLKVLNKYYKGRILFAEDLMTINVLNGSDQVTKGLTTGERSRNPIDFLDSDYDGRISRDEARGPLQQDFDRIDRNNDGYITVDEMPSRTSPQRKFRRGSW